MKFENVVSERIQTQGLYIVQFHVYEITSDKSIEEESRLVLRCWWEMSDTLPATSGNPPVRNKMLET